MGGPGFFGNPQAITPTTGGLTNTATASTAGSGTTTTTGTAPAQTPGAGFELAAQTQVPGTSLTGVPSWISDFTASGSGDMNSWFQNKSGYSMAPGAATPQPEYGPPAAAPTSIPPPAAAPQQKSGFQSGNAPWGAGWSWGGPGSANPSAPAVAGMDPQMLANMSPATLKAILGGGWNAPGVQGSLVPYGQQASQLVQKWGAQGAPEDFYNYVNWRLGTAGMAGTPDANSTGDPRTGWQQGYYSAIH